MNVHLMVLIILRISILWTLRDGMRWSEMNGGIGRGGSWIYPSQSSLPYSIPFIL